MSEFLDSTPKTQPGEGVGRNYKEGEHLVVVEKVGEIKFMQNSRPPMHKFPVFFNLVYAEGEEVFDIPPLYVGMRGPRLSDGLTGGELSYMGQRVWDNLMRAIVFPEGKQVNPFEDLKDACLRVTVRLSKNGRCFTEDRSLLPATEEDREKAKAFLLNRPPF